MEFIDPKWIEFYFRRTDAIKNVAGILYDAHMQLGFLAKSRYKPILFIFVSAKTAVVQLFDFHDVVPR